MSIQNGRCWLVWARRLLTVSSAIVLLSFPAVAQHASGSHPEHTGATTQVHEQEMSTTGQMQGKQGEALLTIRYHCTRQSSTGQKIGTCEIKVSKQEFESLVQAMDPKMTSSSRLNLAAEYARVMMMAEEAQRRGLDRSPDVQTLVKYSTMQVLAMQLVRDISAKAPAISAKEVEEYFRNHTRDYQEVVLSRILIPRNSNLGAQVLDRVEAVRRRAMDGERFDALQREVSGVAQASPAPNVGMGPLLCLSLPQAHREVCELNPGEVSQPLADTLGYCIYRLESRRNRPLQDVQDQIRATLERTALQKEIERARHPVSLTLDEQYFGKLPNPDVANEHGMHFPNVQAADPPVPASGHNH